MRFHIKPKRRQLSAEETAANAALRAKRERATMTCQCCARKYLANTGTIAHHGYERPGFGWQTASCGGAKHAPFEVDRSKLGLLIIALERMLKEMQAVRRQIAKQTIPIKRSYREVWNDPKSKRIEFEITAATFADLGPLLRKAAVYSYSWTELLANELGKHDRQIKSISDEIEAQRARYDGWKQTHRWNAEAKEWSKI